MLWKCMLWDCMVCTAWFVLLGLYCLVCTAWLELHGLELHGLERHGLYSHSEMRLLGMMRARTPHNGLRRKTGCQS